MWKNDTLFRLLQLPKGIPHKGGLFPFLSLAADEALESASSSGGSGSGGQPLPASLRSGLFAAALAAEKNGSSGEGDSAPDSAHRPESPEILRVRSPGSLQRLASAAAGKPVDQEDKDEEEGGEKRVNGKRDGDEDGDSKMEASEERRFDHEPWDWKLKSQGSGEEVDADKDADVGADSRQSPSPPPASKSPAAAAAPPVAPSESMVAS